AAPGPGRCPGPQDDLPGCAGAPRLGRRLRAAGRADRPRLRRVQRPRRIRRQAGWFGGGVRSDLPGPLRPPDPPRRQAAGGPRGEVRPYSWIAREIGRPAAARAVGTALAHNPIPFLIPCHRVVRSDGRVGGYLFGPKLKRRVLADEGVDVGALDALAHTGTQY